MTDRRKLRRFLERSLPGVLAEGAAIEIYEGDRLVFREVLDRAFRMEGAGEEAALALWFRPVGYPEWDPRLGMDLYPIERARCLLVDEATEAEGGVALRGPAYRARITRHLGEADAACLDGWRRFRELGLTPEDEAQLDRLRA